MRRSSNDRCPRDWADRCVWATIVAAIGFLLGLPAIAAGGLLDESSWTAESADGRFVLAMIIEEQYQYQGPEYPPDQRADLRQTYARCGIYAAVDPPQLLWRVPYECQAYDAHFSPDGRHVLLARLGWHNISNIPVGSHFVLYHADGGRDYVNVTTAHWGAWTKLGAANLIFPESMEPEWYEWADGSLANDDWSFAIETTHHERMVFDMRSGRLVSVGSWWDRALVGVVCGWPVIVVGGLAWRRRRIVVPAAPRRRGQFSLRTLIAATSALALFLGLWRFNPVLACVLGGTVFLGAAVAQIASVGRRSAVLGAALAAYGFVTGALLFARWGEKPLWKLVEARAVPGVTFLVGLAASAVVAGLAGALFGGWLARRPPSVDDSAS
ncbi:MAG: hypothetical protein CMJ58_15820 [Planctomycetaceae bacterium]|nr:hypothetical protein [Planctomycetaceae bacterium]